MKNIILFLLIFSLIASVNKQYDDNKEAKIDCIEQHILCKDKKHDLMYVLCFEEISSHIYMYFSYNKKRFYYPEGCIGSHCRKSAYDELYKELKKTPNCL